MVIIVAIVLTKGKQWLIRTKDVSVKRFDNREEISADVAGTQIT